MLWIAGGMALAVLAAGCGSSKPASAPASTAPSGSAAAAGSPSSVSAPTKSVLTIGVVENNVSATTGSTVPDYPATVAAWTSWVNSHGGINGHPVKVIEQNDNNDAAQAVAAANALASNSKVLAILDDDTYDSAWQNVASQAKVPVICGSASGNGFPCNSQADFFPAGGTVLTSIWGQSKAAALAGAKVYGLFNCTQPACAPAAPLEKKYAVENGLVYGYQATASPTAPDYTAQCLAAKDAKVDALFAVVAPRVASDCLRQGYDPIWIESQGAYTASLRQNANFKYVTGDVGDFPWFLDGNPATHAFHQAMSKYWPNFDTFGSAYSATSTWAGLQLFAAAAAHVPDNPTRQDIFSGIYALPPNFTLGGLIPPETITEGKPTLNSCVFIVDIKNAQYSAPYGLKTFCQQPSTGS
jgi:branched-chain amino acid transport system substrate-binding protein